VTDHKKPVDQLIDLLVYAPLGFALDARALLPKLIDRGHDQVSNQVTIARMMGQFAVKQGQSEATKQLGHLQGQATTALAELGLLPKAEPPAPVPVPEAPPAAAAPAPAPEPSAKPAAKRAASKPVAKAVPVPTIASLAIPDYDSLAASQVIPRLEGLAAGELEAVRRYEDAHRGRKTILNKIAQLQG